MILASRRSTARSQDVSGAQHSGNRASAAPQLPFSIQSSRPERYPIWSPLGPGILEATVAPGPQPRSPAHETTRQISDRALPGLHALMPQRKACVRATPSHWAPWHWTTALAPLRRITAPHVAHVLHTPLVPNSVLQGARFLSFMQRPLAPDGRYVLSGPSGRTHAPPSGRFASIFVRLPGSPDRRHGVACRVQAYSPRNLHIGSI